MLVTVVIVVKFKNYSSWQMRYVRLQAHIQMARPRVVSMRGGKRKIRIDRICFSDFKRCFHFRADKREGHGTIRFYGASTLPPPPRSIVMERPSVSDDGVVRQRVCRSGGNYKSHMMVHLHTSIGAGDLDIIAVENGSQSIWQESALLVCLK